MCPHCVSVVCGFVCVVCEWVAGLILHKTETVNQQPPPPDNLRNKSSLEKSKISKSSDGKIANCIKHTDIYKYIVKCNKQTSRVRKHGRRNYSK